MSQLINCTWEAPPNIPSGRTITNYSIENNGVEVSEVGNVLLANGVSIADAGGDMRVRAKYDDDSYGDYSSVVTISGAVTNYVLNFLESNNARVTFTTPLAFVDGVADALNYTFEVLADWGSRPTLVLASNSADTDSYMGVTSTGALKIQLDSGIELNTAAAAIPTGVNTIVLSKNTANVFALTVNGAAVALTETGAVGANVAKISYNELGYSAVGWFFNVKHDRISNNATSYEFNQGSGTDLGNGGAIVADNITGVWELV